MAMAAMAPRHDAARVLTTPDLRGVMAAGWMRMGEMASARLTFEQAARDVQLLPQRPDNETLLRLYALYKQGSEGDISGQKPGFFDFVGTAKHEAWSRLKGTPPELAQQQYIDLVASLKG